MNNQALQQAEQNIRRNQQDSSTIRYRLDTSDLKNNIRYYLSGMRKQQKVIDGDMQTVWVQDDKMRKMNERGIHSVMTLIESSVNSSVVQGNLDEKEYRTITADFHQALYRHLFLNGHRFNLSDDDYEMVIETITHMVRLFTSRTINNLERKSYENSMSVNESQRIEQNSGRNFLSRLFS